MSNLADWIDGDGLVGLEKDVHDRPSSQNGYFYTGLAYILTNQKPGDELDLAIDMAFDEFGYRRNSVTQDLISFDDGFAMCALIPEVRDDFKKNWGMHPARTDNSLRWFMFRNPVFTSCVLFPNSFSLLRDISVAMCGAWEAGSTPFLLSFLISELYPTREWAKRALRKRALKRFPNFPYDNIWKYKGLTGAFEVYFGDQQPLVQLSYEFESRRNL